MRREVTGLMLPRHAARGRRGLRPRVGEMNTALSVLALLVALLALALEVAPRIRASRRDLADPSDLPEDALSLRHEVAALRAEGALALKNLAVVRYDAFPTALDKGGSGQLSWSLA